MDFKKQQDRFDVIKWYDSIVAGCDMCGTYEFCGACNKDLENPCARAAYKYRKGVVHLATIRLKIGAKK